MTSAAVSNSDQKQWLYMNSIFVIEVCHIGVIFLNSDQDMIS